MADNSVCVFKEKWNAHECKDQFGVLLIDSLDADRMDRSAQPVYIKNDEYCNKDETCFNNRLNAYMDNCWDGFYTCQQREQRFPTLVDQDADYYEIEYTGTPPEKQEFVLHAATGTPGFIVKIKYSNANSYMVTDDKGNIQNPTPWSHSLNNYAPISSYRCGENRYQGVVNILEFYITPDCPLFIQPRNTIMLGVRLEFEMNEFFEAGGVTTFIDNMAASLGIHKADLRVVAVYQGSTIIDFEVISGFLEDTPLDLGKVEQTFTDLMAVSPEFMGSVILSAVASTIPIITVNGPSREDIEAEMKNIWDAREEDKVDEFGDPILGQDEEQNVNIDIVYQDITVNYNKDTAAEVNGFTAIIGMIMIIIILISIAVCLYKKIISQAEVRKAEIPAGLEKHPELDSHGFEDQYVPNALFKKKTGANREFGGVDFEKKNTRNMNKNMDDLVFGSSTSDQKSSVACSAAKLNDSEGPLFDDISRSSIALPVLEEGSTVSPLKKDITRK